MYNCQIKKCLPRFAEYQRQQEEYQQHQQEESRVQTEALQQTQKEISAGVTS